jgi:cell wall-associated NlpC family hydrolase
VISRPRSVLLVLVLVAAFLASHASAASTRAQRTTRQSAFGLRAVVFARHLLGVPYEWGGTSPRTGFDCSGFVQFVYRHLGIDLPRTTYSQFDTGRRVSRAGLEPGDLVFFDGVGHVGLYVGGGRFIHAPHSGTTVQISSLGDAWYGSRFDGARRLAAPVVRVVAHGVARTVVHAAARRMGRIPVAWRAPRPG